MVKNVTPLPHGVRVTGTGPAAQHLRRQRIMQTAIALVMAEGYDGLQMRHVAAAAQVSTRTLYHHFPSKEHLILASMVERDDVMERFLGNGERPGRSPAQRVHQTLTSSSEALQAVPALTTGMFKALVSGQASIIPILSQFRDTMITAIAVAIRPSGATEADLSIARTLQRVWLTALLAWSSGIETRESFNQAIDEAIALLLPDTTRRTR
jgi:AcrR family transcriptional regulator